MGGDGEGFHVVWMKMTLKANRVPEGNVIIVHMRGGRGIIKFKVCVGGDRVSDEDPLEMFESDQWDTIDVV